MKLVVIWEHDYDKLLEEDPDAKAFVANLDLTDRLDPRDSLMGGRTNGCVLYKRASQGTQIKYVDFTSLYPFVYKIARYPTGHPELAKVKVLPPRGLFHPVLGYRSYEKLTFQLCRSCVERQQKEPCACSDADRVLTGTYCTPELLKAIEKGYKILKIYEVYHWEDSTQYDPSSKTGGLFAPYINMFLKIKQEASGRPDWVKTEDDLARYIEMYEQREGIRLDPDNIEHNPGLRSLMANPTIEIQDFNIIDDHHLMLTTKRTSEDMCDPGHSNVFLASFTTCWARLKLYELLDMLKTRVLY
ncbi:uncharacterized protein LOC128169970 [Crassostrea angulata]|uniref:uncharacterized protein LOC128169970 n=1 Tax=Magallana angulata TaxID=2784310 RepID=UPI0022B1DB15|nr:uncharacterized protein LOC128169970 [Crassostrea angulata]